LSHRTRKPPLTGSQQIAAQIASGIPACWTWPLPSPAETGAVLTEDVSQAARYKLMYAWQDGRCAICGRCKSALVRDHDHDSDLMRGLLCRRCNFDESIKRSRLIDRYHLINPASICGLRKRYPRAAEVMKPLKPTQADGEWFRAISGYRTWGDAGLRLAQESVDCECGWDHQISEGFRAAIAGHVGGVIQVAAREGVWLIPFTYFVLHGLTPKDAAAVAWRYGFRRMEVQGSGTAAT
jgi:hypothetical protein